MSKKWLLLFAPVVFALCPLSSASAADVATAFYQYAKAGDVRSISSMVRRGYSLEMPDANGMTPVCSAVANRDPSSLNLLLEMGANPSPACLKALPESLVQEVQAAATEEAAATSGSSTAAVAKEAYHPVVYAPTPTATVAGLTPMTWGGLAVLTVGGSAAAVAASSGGGGSSKKESSKVVSCGIHGTLEDGKCVCESGWSGDDCSHESTCSGYNLAACPNIRTECYSCQKGTTKVYKKVGCVIGYEGDDCSIQVCNGHGSQNLDGSCSCTEGWEGTDCNTEKTCSGYNLSSCPNHTVCAPCKKGDTTVYQKTGCADGYEGADCSTQVCNGKGTKNEQGICVCNTGYVLDGAGSCVAKSTTSEVIKTGSDLTAANITSATYHYSNTANLFTNVGTPKDAYGIQNPSSNGVTRVVNLLYYTATKTSGSTTTEDTNNSVKNATTASIQITTAASGDLYGIYSPGNTAINVFGHGAQQDLSATITLSKIRANHDTLEGHIFGIYTDTPTVSEAAPAINAYSFISEPQTKISGMAYHTSTGTISLTGINTYNDDGGATLSGLYTSDGATYAANALAGGGKSGMTSMSVGNIQISNSGLAYVLGIRSGYAYNAAVVPSTGDSHLTGETSSTSTLNPYAYAEGTINIQKTYGTGYIYGAYGVTAVYNAFKDILSTTAAKYVGTVSGRITITNSGDSEISGITAGGSNGKAVNLWDNGITYLEDDGNKSIANIQIFNTGHGKVYGLYATASSSANGVVISNDKPSSYNAAQKKAYALASIGLGDEVNRIVGNGDTYGMYIAATGNRNAGAWIDTGAGLLEDLSAQVFVYHETPTYDSTDSVNPKIYGYYTNGDAQNAAGYINNSTFTSKVTGEIFVSENNVSAYTGSGTATNGKNVSVYGVYTKGDFTNALLTPYDTSVVNPKSWANVTGNISVKAKTNDSSSAEVTSYGIYANSTTATVYNARDDGVSKPTTNTTGNSVMVLGNIYMSGEKGSITGIYARNAYNAFNTASGVTKDEVKGIITLSGAGLIKGMSSSGAAYLVNAHSLGGGATGVIWINRNADNSSSAWGMYTNVNDGQTYNAFAQGSEGLINVFYRGSGSAYGMQGATVNSGTGSSTINMILVPYTSTSTNKASGKAYGMYGRYLTNDTGDNINVNYVGAKYTNGSSTISNVSADESAVYGMYGLEGSNITNKGTISIARAAYDQKLHQNDTETLATWTPDNTYYGGKAYGIYSEGNGATITNSGTINVNGVAESYGIYVADGTNTTITNSGTIHVTQNGYGIYIASNSNATQNNAVIVNAGTITLGWGDGSVSCSGNDCFVTDTTNPLEHAIKRDTASASSSPASFMYLNGSTLLNQSEFASENNLDFDEFDGTMALGEGGSYAAPGVSGNLFVDKGALMNTFDSTYTFKDAINADDVSKLNLKSQSALFDVALAENGHDVVMQMKSFDKVTDNASFAKFLAQNYALKNNEKFFNALKEMATKSALTNTLNQMMGQDMLSRFAFEDMSMMRELNFDVNNNLFNMKEDHLTTAGFVSSPMAFKGDTGSNSRYSLTSKSDGVWTLGLGVAFTDIRSDDNNNDNARAESMYQMIVPVGYKAGGFKFVVSPRFGYARGNYDRTGFEDKTYDGTIEKRIFGLMNEARYPIKAGDWRFEPAVEFNMLGYEQKGREDAKEFSLVIPKQRTYSVESGVGLYATHEAKLSKNTSVKFTTGLSAYHEFADPYKMDVGMNGMDGRFTLRDERRTDNRAVARAGFNYDTGAYGVDASIMSYIDRETRTKANLGFRWKF